jgi:hypothetical protein
MKKSLLVGVSLFFLSGVAMAFGHHFHGGGMRFVPPPVYGGYVSPPMFVPPVTVMPYMSAPMPVPVPAPVYNQPLRCVQVYQLSNGQVVCVLPTAPAPLYRGW